MSNQKNEEVLKESLAIYDKFWYKYPIMEEFIYTNIRKFSPNSVQDEQLAHKVFSQISEAYNLLLGCFKILPNLYEGNELAIKEGQLAEKAKNMRKAYEDMKKYVNIKDAELEAFPAPRGIERPTDLTYGEATEKYLSSLAEGEEPSVEGLKKSVEEYYSTKNQIPKRTYADSLLDSQFETHYPDQFWGEERKHRF